MPSLIRLVTLVIAAICCAAPVAAWAQSGVDAEAAYARGDFARAAQIWSVLAEQQDARAQTFLAMLYRDGKGVTQNLQTAASWYAKAAAQGDPIAQGQLGSFYAAGRGVPMDSEQAAYWLRLSAEQGNAPAAANLGALYDEGKGVPRNETFALALYMQAYARAPNNKFIANLYQERSARATPEMRARAASLVQQLGQAGGYATVLDTRPTPQVANAPVAPPGTASARTMSQEERQRAFDKAARAAPVVTINESNPAALEGRRSLEARMKCEASVKGRVWTDDETQAIVEKCYKDEMQRSGQRESAVAAAAENPRAIFGLLVGAPLPPRILKCNENLRSDAPLVPAGRPYCLSMLATGLEALVGYFDDMDASDYRKIGIHFGTLGINDQIYDTRLAQGVTVYIDKAETLHMLMVRTWAWQYKDVLAMLTNKYGRPTRQSTAQWVNRQTGQVVGTSPNYVWNVSGLIVEYQSQVAGLLNDRTATGQITIYTPDLARRVQAYIAQRDGPDPRRKPM